MIIFYDVVGVRINIIFVTGGYSGSQEENHMLLKRNRKLNLIYECEHIFVV